MNSLLRNIAIASTVPVTYIINNDKPHLALLQSPNFPGLHTNPEKPSTEKKQAGSEKKGRGSKKGKNDDDGNGSGGLLEPIIEDLQGWIKRRRPEPTASAFL